MILSKLRVVLVLVVLTVAVSAWLTIDKVSTKEEIDITGIEQIGSMKRLNARQYEHIVSDIFGAAINIKGRLSDVSQREEGLLAVGATRVSLSPVGMEVAEDLARDIAAQVVSEDLRDELIACRPKSDETYDQVCAEQFLRTVGRLLYRRPLSHQELHNYKQLAAQTAAKKQSFYAGLERVLANMLVSPNFLFHIEYIVPNSDGRFELTPFSKASRLSFLLWDSTPDTALLDAVASGDFARRAGLAEQVDRMLSSPRLEQGVRAFFSDMFVLDKFDTLEKDSVLYPNFTAQVMSDAREQTLKTVVDHLLERRGDYRDLFITPNTFLTPELAAQMGIPLVQRRFTGMPDYWTAYRFPEGDPRVGLLAQPGFVALHSPPGRSSPTLRGKALRENLLCQEVPPPPGDVDFSQFQASDGSLHKTARDRLKAHAVNPTCAGCHKITDPIGLALESFNSAGQYRTTENGVHLDTSGDLDGVQFADAAGLGQALRDNPAVVSCLIRRVYAYGVGRDAEPAERKWLRKVRSEFANTGYQLPELFRLMGGSEKFYAASVADDHSAALAVTARAQ